MKSPSPSPSSTLVIDTRAIPVTRRIRDLWAYRELLCFLAVRDLKVRYKQTLLGVAWAIIQPLFTMLVFSIFFGYLGRIPSDGVPYPLFAYAGLLPWSLFATALAESSNSLVNNQSLITKVYFPRLLIPMAPLLVGLVDFSMAFLVFFVMLFVYGMLPGMAILALPLFVLLALLTALTVATWLGALNVQYRDVRYTIPFLSQLWLFATPVAYPSSLLPEPWRTLYGLNPMAGVVEGFRWCLIGGTHAPGPLLAVSVVAVIALLLGGLWYFNRVEQSFADHI